MSGTTDSMDVYQRVFDILKVSLGTDTSKIDAANIVCDDALFTELKDQTVLTLTYGVFDQLSMEKNLREEWESAIFSQIYCGVNLKHCEQQIISILREKEISFAVIKGTAAAKYYAHPEYRTSGDIDILVKPEDFEKSVEALKEDGFIVTEDDPYSRHTALSRNNTTVEIHRSFFSSILYDSEKNMDDELLSKIDEIKWEKVLNYSIPVLPEEYNGLVLLRHIKQHLTSGLGLRQIVDWMMFVDKTCNDEFWQEKMLPLADRSGLDIIAKSVTYICKMYLGLRDSISWYEGVDEDKCKDLINLIMYKGNFGKKSFGTEEKIIDKLGRNTSINKSISRLQSNGIFLWQEARDNPVLRKFAWLHQIIRYIKLGKKANIRHIFRILKEIRKRKRLYYYLRID